MSTVSPKIQDLARQLLALEAARAGPSLDGLEETVRVFEKLRVRISKLVGVAGYRSLLSRSLSLARAEVASLGRVSVREDGTLGGLDPSGRDSGPGIAADGALVLMVHFMGLLVTFIGPALTLNLVRGAWPGICFNETDLGSGGMV